MERFPVSLIQEPTAFTSHDPMEIYNNILVFIVGDERQSSNSHSEMHIFQVFSHTYVIIYSCSCCDFIC